MFVLDGAVPTSSPIYNLHSGQFCQVLQLMMPEYCDENHFSTGSDRAAKIFKAAICFGQLRLIYIYIYTHFAVSCCCCFPALSKNTYRSDGLFESTTTCRLEVLQGIYLSQLLRWQQQQQHPHYSEIARMLTQCFNRFVDLANRHNEVFFERRDCTWLRGFLYYLIHRASCGFTIEQWVDWVRNATPKKLFLARWTREEWGAY